MAQKSVNWLLKYAVKYDRNLFLIEFTGIVLNFSCLVHNSERCDASFKFTDRFNSEHALQYEKIF